MEVSLSVAEGYDINNFLKEIKKANQWIVIGDSAIQISKIKRIVAR